jgi:Cap4 SAVED domain
VVGAPELAFGRLLDPIDGLDNVLKEVDSSPRLEQPRLLFLRFRQEEPELEALAELLTDLLVDYAIPLSKRQQANTAGISSITQGSTAMHVRLYREAKRLLIEYEKANQGRYGELGELLSYALAVHYLGAAQIGSKMALKTSQGMPVHGVDGLHVRANADGTVSFFVLESKVMPDATDASRDMVASISDYRADRSKKLNELRLVTDLSNLETLTGDQREAAKSFFNAYQGNGNHLKRRDVHVGSLVFSESAYQDRLPVDHEKPITIHEEHLEKLYREKHSRFKENLERQAATKGLDLGHCIVFLVAVPDINELKSAFAGLNR